MTKQPTEERITIDGVNVVLQRDVSPMVNGGVLAMQDMLRVLNVFDQNLRPSNYGQADGKPMRLFDGKVVKVDLSKRSHEDMGFWHRNIDAHEIILCVKGALHWETEMGERVLREGDMLFIPRGIAHRSRLSEFSAEENVLVELKIAEPLEYVADRQNG
jgi:homogentisate 1,2-dioxygenase